MTANRRFEDLPAPIRALALDYATQQVKEMMAVTVAMFRPEGETGQFWGVMKLATLDYAQAIHDEFKRQAFAANEEANDTQAVQSMEALRLEVADDPASPEPLTLAEVYECIAEMLAGVRSYKAMGETQEANRLFAEASSMFHQYYEALSAFPGWASLDTAYGVTLEALTGAKATPLMMQNMSHTQTPRKPSLMGNGGKQRYPGNV